MPSAEGLADLIPQGLLILSKIELQLLSESNVIELDCQ